MNIYTKEAITTLLALKANAADLIIETTARADADTTLQTNINKKQDKLTFDTTPTANSTNPVTSGGIKTYVDSAVSSVYKYKGSVATYADLPTTNLTIGDVYNVEDTGDNYAWTGTVWDKLAGTVDLSAYLTTTTAENTYAKLSSIIDVAYQDDANTFTAVQYFKSNITTSNITPNKSDIYSIGESAKPYRNIYATKLYGFGMVQAGDLIITTSMQYYDGTSTWTYTLPAKTGTIALTSDIPSTTTNLVFYNSDDTVLATVQVYSK